MSEFFVPDSSPLIAYSSNNGVEQWRGTYARQGDSYDQTLHVTTESQASLELNISATRLTIQVPSFANCSATISLNESIPVTACSTSSTLFTIGGLPAGTHRLKYNVGDVSPLVAKGNELVFWGVAGSAASPPKNVRNITIDNTFESMPAADSALHPINLTFSSDWQQLYGQGAGPAQTSMDVETVGAAYNTSIATTTKKGAKMTFTAHGSAMYLYGNTGVDYGSASVTLNGAVVALSLNLTRPWDSGYDLLWFQDGLDMLHESTLVLTNLEDRRLSVDFLMLTADESQVNAILNSMPSGGFLSKPAGKAVVYGVLPLVVCATFGILALLLVRRRRNRQPPGMAVLQEDDGEKSQRSSFQCDEPQGSVFYSYNSSADRRRDSDQSHFTDRSRSQLLSPADSYKMEMRGEPNSHGHLEGRSPDSDISPATDRTYQLPYERSSTTEGPQSPGSIAEPFIRPAAPTLGGSQAASASIDGRLDTLASLTGTGRSSLVRMIQEAIALGGAISPRSTSTIPPAYSSGFVTPTDAEATGEKFVHHDTDVRGAVSGPSSWQTQVRGDDMSSRNSAITGRRVGAPSIISMLGAPPSLTRMSTASSNTGLRWEDFRDPDAPPLPSNGLAVDTNMESYPRPVSVTSATAESLLEPRSTTTLDFHRKLDWPVPPVPLLHRLQTDQMSVTAASFSGAARPDSELYHYESPLLSTYSSPSGQTPSPSARRLLRHRASSSFSGEPVASTRQSPARRSSFTSSSPDLSQMPAARIGAGLLTPGSERGVSPFNDPSPVDQTRLALRAPSTISKSSEVISPVSSPSSYRKPTAALAPPINMSALGDRKLENPEAFRFSGVIGPRRTPIDEPSPIAESDSTQPRGWKEVMKWKTATTKAEGGGSGDEGSFLRLGPRSNNSNQI